MKKKQNVYLWMSLLLILVIVGITFQPARMELFHRYPYSYASLQNKQESIDSANKDYERIQNNIPSLRNQLDSVREEVREIESGRMSRMDDIEHMVTDRHMPSILILLENYATETNLDLTIHYGSIYEVGSKNGNQSEEPSEDNEENEENEQEEMPEPDEVDNGYIQIYEQRIPVTLEGTYSQTRTFISILEEKDFIEPRSIRITSQGDAVTSNLNVSVFSTEAFSEDTVHDHLRNNLVPLGGSTESSEEE